MNMFYFQTMVTALAAASTSSALHRLSPSRPFPEINGLVRVEVGTAGNLIFSPDRVTALEGTTLRFNFLALNHTLTRSSLANPCESSGGIDTGFEQYNPNNVSGFFLIDFVVESKEPQYFFCAQSSERSHCNAGMVYSLNAGQLADTFVENAMSPRATATAIKHTLGFCRVVPDATFAPMTTPMPTLLVGSVPTTGTPHVWTPQSYEALTTTTQGHYNLSTRWLKGPTRPPLMSSEAALRPSVLGACILVMALAMAWVF